MYNPKLVSWVGSFQSLHFLLWPYCTACWGLGRTSLRLGPSWTSKTRRLSTDCRCQIADQCHPGSGTHSEKFNWQPSARSFSGWSLGTVTQEELGCLFWPWDPDSQGTRGCLSTCRRSTVWNSSSSPISNRTLQLVSRAPRTQPGTRRPVWAWCPRSQSLYRLLPSDRSNIGAQTATCLCQSYPRGRRPRKNHFSLSCLLSDCF